MTARSFADAFAAARARSVEDIRADLEIGPDDDRFGDVAFVLADDVEPLLDKLDGAIRWAVTLEGQNAAMEAKIADLGEPEVTYWIEHGGSYYEVVSGDKEATHVETVYRTMRPVAALTGSTE